MRGGGRRLFPRLARGALGGFAFLGVLGGSWAFAQNLVHEHFRPDPQEDLRLGATTSGGTMPAAVQTQSGLIQAPDDTLASSAPGERNEVYGGAQTPDSIDAGFYLDRQTEGPTSVHYDEPFRPSILPFKRTYAFDLVKPDLSLGVFDKELTRVPVGGIAADDEDVFFGDLTVDLIKDVPVRIPSIGPGTRVRALSLDPPGAVEVFEDGAENWFLRAERTGRARLILQLSIPQSTFGSAFPQVPFGVLRPHLSPLAPEAKQAAQQVLAQIGLRPGESAPGTLSALVRYFRGFAESSEMPDSPTPLDLYLELSLLQKGVCRHRAFAFLVTAQAAGLPTRLVHNEAHAWVEVFDGELWHRIDLGGAAARIDQGPVDPLLVNHRPPPDPHSWPAQARPASDLALVEAARDPASALSPATDPSATDVASGSPSGAGDSPSSQGPFSFTDPSQPGEGSNNTPPENVRVTFSTERGEAKRGGPLRVSGRATRSGAPCRLSRVDVFIVASDKKTLIGSVATDRQGYYLGQVTLPRDLPVGDYRAQATLGAGCD